MKKENDNLASLLKFDSLAEAEKITGLDSKSSLFTGVLGMALASVNSERKEQMLRESGDSLFCNDLDDYVNVIKSIGFKKVLSFNFLNDRGIEEQFYIFWNSEHSVMIEIETYCGWTGGDKPSVNSATMHYNWCPFVSGQFHPFTGSGQPIGEVYAGYNDAREAVKYQFNAFLNNGAFVKKWVKVPDSLWFLTRADYKKGINSFDYHSLISERYSSLPDEVIFNTTPIL